MRVTSRPCRVARPMSKMPSGSQTCCATAYCNRVTSLRLNCGSCARSCVIGSSWSTPGALGRNRIIKLLESANIKLSGVISDPFGVSGRLMLDALKRGVASAEEMAELAKKRLRSKLPLLKLALDGRMEAHHRQLLSIQLDRLDRFDRDLKQMDAKLEAKLKPYARQMELLDDIPGIDWVVGATINCRDGHQDGPVADSRPSDFLGWPVSGAKRERRQTRQDLHSSRQSVLALGAGRGGPRRNPREGLLLSRNIIGSRLAAVTNALWSLLRTSFWSPS